MPVLTSNEIAAENERYGFHEIDLSKPEKSQLTMRCLQQGNLMKVKIDQKLSNLARRHQQGGTRGRVKGFSKASRKRLLEVFAGLDTRRIKDSGVAFLTLTYGQVWPHPAQAKKHLEAYVRRICRRSENEDPAFVWKMEPQERGAPHFHVCIFGWKRSKDGWPITKDDFSRHWGEVIGAEYLDYKLFNVTVDPSDIRAPFTRIEHVRSFKRLMVYVSKYMAKTDDDKSLDHRAGIHNPGLPAAACSRDQEDGLPFEDSASTLISPDCCPGQEDPALPGPADGAAVAGPGESGFNNLAYLATDGTPIEFIGRSWGIMFRSALPNAPRQTVIIECDGRFEGFARHIGWRWAQISTDLKGFTVFHEHADVWFETLQRYIHTIEGVPF